MTTRILTLHIATAVFVLSQGRGPQPSQPLTPSERADTQTLSRTVQALRRTAKLSPEATTQTDKLIEESTGLLASGQTAEARRRLAHAQSLIAGTTWEPKDELAWSLAFRSRQIVMEPSHPFLAELSQVYSAPNKLTPGVRVKVSLFSAGPDSKFIKDVGEFDVPSRDLVADPAVAQLEWKGTPDGTYRLHAEVASGDVKLATFQQTIALAEGIETRSADAERRLGKIQGHDSAKASVRWPFDIARVINTGIRKLETNDFGLPESGAQYFDFGTELKKSGEILKALEAGKDPVVRAKGDHERHYWFEEAGEMMPYRLYVPTTWDGKKQLPMMFVMHGTTRDDNFYFDRDGGVLPKLAEKNGYIVVSVMGYRPNSGYNAQAINGLAGAAPNPGAPNQTARARESELSEKDAMNAFDLVVKEYNPDPKRIYLFGHSAGGTGGWYIGSKYAERFAGLGLSAFGTQPGVVPWDRLKGMPIMVIVGTKDAPNTVKTVETMAKAVADKGFETKFLEVPDATHDTIVGLALPSAFEFFNTHQRK
jgi:poly(3-hydroxybutyrate) depolymerase